MKVLLKIVDPALAAHPEIEKWRREVVDTLNRELGDRLIRIDCYGAITVEFVTDDREMENPVVSRPGGARPAQDA